MRAIAFYIFINFLFTIVLILPVKLHSQQLSFKLYNVNDGLPGISTYGAYQDKNGYLWICSPNGVSRYDGRQFVNYSLLEGLPSLKVEKVFQDSHGRLWAGTSAGMAQFKNNRFISYPTNDRMDITYVLNFAEIKEKQVWALTDKGVYEFANNIWNKVPLYPGNENSACRNVVENNGELYVNYGTDIYCRNKKGKWMLIESDKNFGSIFNALSLQDNEILVSTMSNIYKIENYRLVPVFKKNMGNKDFFSFWVDTKNRLWIGGDGFLKISKPFDWNHFPVSINLKGYIFNIVEDRVGNIWTASTEGLMKLKNISYALIDKNKSAPLDGIYNIMPLSGKRMIFSSGTKSGLLLYKNYCCKPILPPPSSGNKNYFKDPVTTYTFDKRNSIWMATHFRKFLHFDGTKLSDFSGALKLKTTEYIYDLEFVKKRNQFFICADSTLLYGNSLHFSVFIPSNTKTAIIKPTRVYELKNGLLLIEKESLRLIQQTILFRSLKKRVLMEAKKVLS